jgi:integrase
MARRPRARKLETRTQRLKLATQPKPHEFTTIAPGKAVGYRRNLGPGVFVLRVADGKGGNWTKAIGVADDFADADGTNVLTFWQAVDKGLKLVHGTDDAAGRPATFAEAIDAYEKDLAAQGHAVDNATRVRKRLPPTLAAKVVAMLRETDLSTWRDNLLAGGMPPTTYVRIARGAKAALNLCARRDPRIQNAAAWRHGLGGIPDSYESRNILRLTDDQVRAVIKAAYAVDYFFGLLVETAAQTGARLSQLARLIVADLLLEDGSPKLAIPSSRKGSRRGKPYKVSKRNVPISAALAAKLQSNRSADATLLVRSDSRAWQSNRNDHMKLYAQAAKAAGVKGSVTQLRHSSIIRSLLRGTPVRLTASLPDTSVAMIEATYSKHIADFGDEVARAALLDTDC